MSKYDTDRFLGLFFFSVCFSFRSKRSGSSSFILSADEIVNKETHYFSKTKDFIVG